MKERTKKWIHVVLFSVIVFSTLPLGPSIRDLIYRNLGERFVIYFVASLLAAGLIIAFIYGYRRTGKPTVSSLLWTLLIGYLYWLALERTFKIPIESVHFVEYGILSLLICRAFRTSFDETFIYLAAFLLTYCLGAVDEFIQWFLSNRVGALRDIVFNGLSGGLVQLLLWKGVGSKNLKKGFPAKSFRVVAFLSPAAVLLTSLFISLVSDFGFKIEDKEVGSFFSRLTREELLQRDAQMFEHYAARIDSSYAVPYAEFLENTDDPFLYEMRVRLFRRDRHFEGESYRASCCEEAILRKYFGKSLESSAQTWPQGRDSVCSELERDCSTYKSPVSQELIVKFRERDMWTVTSVLFLIFLYLGTRRSLTTGRDASRKI